MAEIPEHLLKRAEAARRATQPEGFGHHTPTPGYPAANDGAVRAERRAELIKSLSLVPDHLAHRRGRIIEELLDLDPPFSKGDAIDDGSTVRLPEGMDTETAQGILEQYQTGELVSVPEGMDPVTAREVLARFHELWLERQSDEPQ